MKYGPMVKLMIQKLKYLVKRLCRWCSQQMDIQVVDTSSQAFNGYLDTLRDEDGDLPDICEINVPTRTAE